jgi:hypothetical protein
MKNDTNNFSSSRVFAFIHRKFPLSTWKHFQGKLWFHAFLADIVFKEWQQNPRFWEDLVNGRNEEFPAGKHELLSYWLIIFYEDDIQPFPTVLRSFTVLWYSNSNHSNIWYIYFINVILIGSAIKKTPKYLVHWLRNSDICI